MNTSSAYSRNEEIFNSISHGVGILLAVVGTAVMVTLAALGGSALAVAAALVYGLSLVVMYTMSTLYHAIPFPRVKRVLQILDHDCIYLLIAGTYTPITLITLRDSPRGATILIAVWAAAILGCVLNAVDLQRFKRASLLLYVVMGWAVLYDLRRVMEGLGSGGFALLLIGGVCYTGGIAFYKMKKTPYMHGIWHLFVVSGSVFHYFCILLYVLWAA